jgi:hypothetical protein
MESARSRGRTRRELERSPWWGTRLDVPERPSPEQSDAMTAPRCDVLPSAAGGSAGGAMPAAQGSIR